MSKQFDLGKWGETIALQYLTKKGYTFEKANWHWRHNEIDLIFTTDREIVFVEVKTRTAGVLAKPEEALTRQKQKLLIDAANAYIEKNDINKEARFDVITIWVNGKDHKIKHIPEAITPQW
ncbi:MAG: YraN family protein [Salinivirgaceae bacterium]|nr:MAG: YraN family protein [Salinivirgaceae bacterium]